MEMVITRSQTTAMHTDLKKEKKRKRNNHNHNHYINSKRKRRDRLFRNDVKKKKKKSIEIGDTINLSHLLFTKKRNYLFNYKQNKRVKAKDLAGKLVVVHFMSLVDNFYWRTVITNLLDIYSKLQPTGGFEIVCVAVRDELSYQFECLNSTPRKCFLEKFSTMPWPAIPMSDRKSRIRLERIFGVSSDVDHEFCSFVIDPRGVVLQCNATPLFLRYGAAGYPFTNERIQFLDSEDDLVQMHPPSVEKLLASPERDYLINNKGDQVPLCNLDDKAVGLYFCPCTHYHHLTKNLNLVYEELYKNVKDFEIVLIYAHGWFEHYYGRTDEDSFMEAFETMPWLALPFKDTNCSKKLQRIFQYPQELLEQKPDPRLVIIGPHGEFIEPWGANILLQYGASAYPFSRFTAVNLELEKVNKVKLEKFWDLDAVFTRKNGTQVRFSQLVGKRIIVLSTYFGSIGTVIDGMVIDKTLRELKARYIRMKGTSDEFEVIQIHDMMLVGKNGEAMPWLMHHPFDEDSYASKFIDHVFGSKYHGLLAFDPDGLLVRRTKYPTLGDNMVFPFYPDGEDGNNGDMENEVLLDVERILELKVKTLNGGRL